MQGLHVGNSLLEQRLSSNIPAVENRSLHGAGGFFGNRFSFRQIFTDSDERQSSGAT